MAGDAFPGGRREYVSGPRRSMVWVVWSAILSCGLATMAGMAPGSAGAADLEIIIKYRSEGVHALDGCAEQISRSGGRFQDHTRDRSDSLDRLARRFEIGAQQAVFRAADQPLERERTMLRRRWAASLRKFPRGMKASAQSPGDFPDLAHVYHISVPKGIDANELISTLRADPHVEYAQRSQVMDLDQAFVPNDPFFHSSGSWGQGFSDLWGPARIRAPEVWSRSQGEGAIVAVVDTGLDSLHPDIVGNVWINEGEDLNQNGIADPSDRNGIDDDGNGFIDDLTGFDFANSIDADQDGFYVGPEDVSDADPFDDNGHGSHVAGTIAAVGDNGIGIIGIAPRSKVMALKGFQATGSASDVILWRAVLYAAEMGATVINNSWSCGIPCPENPLAEEVLDLVGMLGAVVVTSAGNSAQDVLFRNPENGKNVITVGALGVDDRIASFSNRGWLMDVVAPGGGPSSPSSVFVARRNILSLLSSGALPFREFFAVGGDYLRFSGTSMSAPHVAGAIAILRSLRPDLSPGDVRRLIRMSAEDLGSPGHDPDYGAGVLDVARLIDMELPDLELDIESPLPGSLHDPNQGAVLVRGHAEGDDLAAVEIEVGAGLSARSFESLTNFGESTTKFQSGSDLGEDVLARWDISNLPDGPYVIRVRARLHDGRVVEEHTVIGIERNSPIQISRGDRAVSRPSLSRRRIVWQIDEAEPQDNGVVNHDLEIGFFPRAGDRAHAEVREPVALFDREGEQRNPILAGREIAWDVRVGGTTTLERCRLESRSNRCEPEPVSVDAGRFSTARIGRNWLVWMRRDQGESRIEGCRVGLRYAECIPQALLAPEAGAGWILASFDGHSLLLRRGTSELARCRLTADPGSCRPQAISFPEDSPRPIELIHDGRLMAFEVPAFENRLPFGCAEVDVSIGCSRQPMPVVSLYACWLTAGDPVCDPKAITPTVLVESLSGVDVSGRRVAWAIAAEEENTAIHFCEFVPETQMCVDQRVGGAPAVQGHPSIDGNRIVWEDGRLGTVGIFGVELPRLRSPRRVRTRPGRYLWLPLRGFAGSSGSLRFEVHGIDGSTPEEANARILSLGRDSKHAVLFGRMPDSASVDSHWRIRAISEGGLFTDRVLEISIDARETSRATRYRDRFPVRHDDDFRRRVGRRSSRLWAPSFRRVR